MNRSFVFFLVGTLILMIAISACIGWAVNNYANHQSKTQIEKELIGHDTKLAWKVLHACGKDWHMINWAPFGNGEIIVDCAPDQTVKGVPYYSTKSVITRR